MLATKIFTTVFSLLPDHFLPSIPKRFALVLLIFLCGCNSLYYQPDKFAYSMPQQITPSFEEYRIPVAGTSEFLHAWRFKSRQPRIGTVLHFHGNAQNMSAHMWFVAWLIDEGYDVITFDYRGYGNSDGIASRGNTIEDGKTILQWASHQADSSPLFVVAQSLGGAIAYASLAVLSTPLPIRGVIIESSFSSYRRLARIKLGSFFLTWPLQWPLSFLVSDDLSPEDLSLKDKVPMLFIHGSRDPVVPFSEGLRFADNSLQEKNDVSFYAELGRGHTSCFASPAGSRCKQHVLEFFKNLSATPFTQESETK